MRMLFGFLLAAALAVQAPAPAPAQSPRAPQGAVVILPPAPGDPPDSVELAAAERLVGLMIPQGALASVMTRRIEELAPHPDFPPRDGAPGEWDARRREIARREARDPNGLRRDRIAATIRREELAAAFARAEPAFRSALALYYERSLPLSDIEAAGRFFATPEGTRFLVATVGFPGAPGFGQAMAAIAPELEAAEARSTRRIAVATATIPRPRADR